MTKNGDVKKKILVVDDSPDQILSVRLIFEFEDKYEVTCAKDGMECLDILKKGNIPDIILLDIMMPKMCGWEVFQNLKSSPEWNDIPVIFLTAYSDIDKEFGSISPEDYIEDPFLLSGIE